MGITKRWRKACRGGEECQELTLGMRMACSKVSEGTWLAGGGSAGMIRQQRHEGGHKIMEP